MHFSRLILEPRSRRVIADIGNPTQLHKKIYRAFPKAGAGRVLYRLDQQRRSSKLLLYVLSEHEPDWSVLDENYLAYTNGIENPSTKPFAPSIQAGVVLNFSLRANPTYKSKTDPKGGQPSARSRRWALRCPRCQDYEQCDSQKKKPDGSCDQVFLQWLQRKGDEGGFQLLQSTIIPEGEEIIKPSSSKASVKLLAVRFAGVLEVTDAENFKASLTQGLGSAKGFGFGLLTVARNVI